MEEVTNNKSVNEKVTNNVPKKKRKTLDEILGINGLLILGIIGGISKNGIFGGIGAICGIGGIVYLIVRRKELTKNQKWVGWILAILFLLSFGSY